MLRSLPRTLARGVPRRVAPARNFAHEAEHKAEQIVLEVQPTEAWVKSRQEIVEHASETTDLWRKISFYVAIPATLLGTLWVRRVEHEHEEHEKHVKAEHGGELPPVPEYPYLNRRAKPFPWGMNSLFFNSHKNKDMSVSE